MKRSWAMPSEDRMRADHVIAARSADSGPAHIHGPWDPTPEGGHKCRRCKHLDRIRHVVKGVGMDPPRDEDGAYYAEMEIADCLVLRHQGGNLFSIGKKDVTNADKLHRYLDLVYLWAWNWGPVLDAMNEVDEPDEEKLLDAAWSVLYPVPRKSFRRVKDGFWKSSEVDYPEGTPKKRKA